MKTRGIIIGGLCVLLLGMFQNVFTKTLEEYYKKKLSFAPGGKIVLENRNGSVTVEGWEYDEVLIEARIEVKGGNEKKLKETMEAVEIMVEAEDNRITIDTRYPDTGFTSIWDVLFGNHVNVNVQYTLKVPLETHLKIKTTNGRIEVREVSGRLMLKTTNGKIAAENVKGVVMAKTTNGSVEARIEKVDPDGEYELITTNGSIKVYLPEETAFDVRARTTNGSIDTDFPLTVQGKWAGHKVRGSVNGGGPLFFLETTNGGIRILKF